MPWASVRDNVRLPLKLAHAPAAEADARVREALAQVGLAEFADSLSARTVRRHEDAGLAGAGAGHRSRYPADGRAVRGARRDHALPAQQRPARSVAQPAQDRRLRHPFGVRVGLSVAARDRDDVAARPHRQRIPHRHAGAARRGFPDVGRLCRLLPRGLQVRCRRLMRGWQAHELAREIRPHPASRRSCSRRALRHGKPWFASTTSSPMCCRGRCWCSGR